MKRKTISLVGIISLLLVAVILIAGCAHKSSCIKQGETSLLIEGKSYPVYYSVSYSNVDDGKVYYQWYNYDIDFKYVPYRLWIVEGIEFPGMVKQMELRSRGSKAMYAHFSPSGNYGFLCKTISEQELQEFPFPVAVAESIKICGSIETDTFMSKEAATQLLEMGSSILKQLKP